LESKCTGNCTVGSNPTLTALCGMNCTYKKPLEIIEIL